MRGGGNFLGFEGLDNESLLMMLGRGIFDSN
jgi:hypothetical protein